MGYCARIVSVASSMWQPAIKWRAGLYLGVGAGIQSHTFPMPSFSCLTQLLWAATSADAAGRTPLREESSPLDALRR